MGANLISKSDIIHLTNQQKRVQFLEEYQKWEQVLEVPELNRRYYSCVLPNDRHIVVQEESVFSADLDIPVRNGMYSEYYYTHGKPGYKFSDFRISEAALVNELKELRKQISEEME